MPDTPAPIVTPATPAIQPVIPTAFYWMFGVVAVMVTGLTLAFGTFLYFDLHPAITPKPFDASLQKIGKAYGPSLAPVRGAAFEKAADDLDAGKPFSQAWASAIKAIQEPYDQQVTPALSAIIPAGTPDDKISAQQTKAMSAALRGLGMGLSGK